MGNTFYFSHDYNARNDPYLAKLRMNEGLAAIGAYWCIIEMLYEQNGRMRRHYDSIAFLLHDKPEWIKKIIENYNLFDYDDELFWSNSVMRRLNEREEKSIKARDSANKRWSSDANAMRTQCSGNAIKESKVKESKREDKLAISSFFSYFLLKTKKEFRLTAANRELIAKRFKEGYKLDDLKKAVDNFVNDEWDGRKNRLDLIYCIGKQKGKPDNLEKWLNSDTKNGGQKWVNP